jgi:hypothetical protein
MSIIYHIHLCSEGQLEYPVGICLHIRLNQISPRADDDCHSYSLIYEIFDLHQVGFYRAVAKDHRRSCELKDSGGDQPEGHTEFRL